MLGEIDLLLKDVGEIYKSAHDIGVRTSHPLALEILNLCNQLATQYMDLKRSENSTKKEVKNANHKSPK